MKHALNLVAANIAVHIMLERLFWPHSSVVPWLVIIVLGCWDSFPGRDASCGFLGAHCAQQLEMKPWMVLLQPQAHHKAISRASQTKTHCAICPATNIVVPRNQKSVPPNSHTGVKFDGSQALWTSKGIHVIQVSGQTSHSDVQVRQGVLNLPIRRWSAWTRPVSTRHILGRFSGGNHILQQNTQRLKTNQKRAKVNTCLPSRKHNCSIEQLKVRPNTINGLDMCKDVRRKA